MQISIREGASRAFADLMEREEISLVEESGELHIIADDWTLVLAGDPPTSAMIALDDESGDPAEMLDSAINTDELAGLRAFDSAVNGEIANLLASSPDPLANYLATALLA